MQACQLRAGPGWVRTVAGMGFYDGVEHDDEAIKGGPGSNNGVSERGKLVPFKPGSERAKLAGRLGGQRSAEQRAEAREALQRMQEATAAMRLTLVELAELPQVDPVALANAADVGIATLVAAVQSGSVPIVSGRDAAAWLTALVNARQLLSGRPTSASVVAHAGVGASSGGLLARVERLVASAAPAEVVEATVGGLDDEVEDADVVVDGPDGPDEAA